MLRMLYYSYSCYKANKENSVEDFHFSGRHKMHCLYEAKVITNTTKINVLLLIKGFISGEVALLV